MGRNVQYWLCQIFGWLAYMVLATISSSQVISTPFKDSLINFLFCVTGLFVSHILRKYYRTKYFTNISLERLVINSCIAISIAAIVIFLLYLGQTYFIDDALYTFVITNKLSVIVGIVFVLIIWTLIYFISKFVSNNRRMVIQGLQMESNVKSLEIKNIKNHLQPHFIFNALNSIRALVDENPAHAREAITQLSNILRSSIQVDKVESLPLKRELEIVKDYLSLERIRYEERLKVSYDIKEETLDLQIPPLLLQTLVENAIKHGIAAFVQGGIIQINSFISGNFHVITIRNTGHLEPKSAEKNTSGEGFGLESSKERLQYLFGNQASLHIQNIPNNMVELTIKIPLNNHKN